MSNEQKTVEVSSDFIEKVAEYKALAEDIQSSLRTENTELKATVAALQKRADTEVFDEKDVKLLLTHIESIAGPLSIDKVAEAKALRSNPGGLLGILEKAAEAKQEADRSATLLRIGSPARAKIETEDKETSKEASDSEWQRATEDLQILLARSA